MNSNKWIAFLLFSLVMQSAAGQRLISSQVTGVFRTQNQPISLGDGFTLELPASSHRFYVGLQVKYADSVLHSGLSLGTLYHLHDIQWISDTIHLHFVAFYYDFCAEYYYYTISISKADKKVKTRLLDLGLFDLEYLRERIYDDESLGFITTPVNPNFIFHINEANNLFLMTERGTFQPYTLELFGKLPMAFQPRYFSLTKETFDKYHFLILYPDAIRSVSIDKADLRINMLGVQNIPKVKRHHLSPQNEIIVFSEKELIRVHREGKIIAISPFVIEDSAKIQHDYSFMYVLQETKSVANDSISYALFKINLGTQAHQTDTLFFKTKIRIQTFQIKSDTLTVNGKYGNQSIEEKYLLYDDFQSIDATCDMAILSESFISAEKLPGQLENYKIISEYEVVNLSNRTLPGFYLSYSRIPSGSNFGRVHYQIPLLPNQVKKVSLTMNWALLSEPMEEYPASKRVPIVCIYPASDLPDYPLSNNCSDSLYFSVSKTSTTELSREDQLPIFSIYPNPAGRENITIRISSVSQTIPVRLRCIDTHGRVISEQTIEPHDSFFHFPSEKLRPGMYLITAVHGINHTPIQTEKLIILPY
jgi:hypothetical protein